MEKVNPKQQETVDAARLAEMCQQGQIRDCIVEGPLSYDILMSKESAAKKGFNSELVGDAGYSGRSQSGMRKYPRKKPWFSLQRRIWRG